RHNRGLFCPCDDGGRVRISAGACGGLTEPGEFCSDRRRADCDRSCSMRRLTAKALIACLSLCIAILAGAATALPGTPEPDFARYEDCSQEIHDAGGHMLGAYLTADQRWRMATHTDDLPKLYWRMLLAY